VRKEVDRSTGRAGKKIDEDVRLVRRILGKEPVRRGLDQDVGVAHGHDRTRQNANLDRLRSSVAVEIRRLVSDV